MPGYWEFWGSFFAERGWFYFSAFLAVLVIAGAALLAVWGASRLVDAGRGWWNLLFVPVVLVVASFLISLLGWSAVGSVVA